VMIGVGASAIARASSHGAALRRRRRGRAVWSISPAGVTLCIYRRGGHVDSWTGPADGRLVAVARIRHSFSVPLEPEQAQAMFVRDIAPDLRRLGGFVLYKNEHGCLAFGDERDLPVAEMGLGAATEPSRWMRRLVERRIRVTFESEPPGTRVTLRGSSPRDVRAALRKLGAPDHWPSTAPRP
jgi:hypothetical protein